MTDSSSEVAWADVIPLWCKDYYDGPISGIAKVDGRVLYFLSLDPDRRHRVYHLFELTDEELQAEEAHHDSFVRGVGGHFTYDGTGSWRRPHPALAANWHDWYDEPKPPLPDYKIVVARGAIGFFTSSPHERRARSKRYWEGKR